MNIQTNTKKTRVNKCKGGASVVETSFHQWLKSKRSSKQIKKEPSEKRKLLDVYFRSDMPVCQVCGGYIERDHADYAHKQHRTKPTAENGMCVHGFRSFYKCHDWIHASSERVRIAELDNANLLNREVVKWPEHQKIKLYQYLKTGIDRPR